MPCRDDTNYGAELGAAHHRITQIAAEACKLRALVLSLGARVPDLSDEDSRQIENVRAAQRVHRMMDKGRAIEDLAQQLRIANQQERHIREIGGVPSAEFEAAISALRERIAAVEKSDPMATDLY